METIYKTFYSHAPRGARQRSHPYAATPRRFLLTHPSRGATYAWLSVSLSGGISTHTPLAGRDRCVYRLNGIPEISTHTPLAGRDRYI